MYDITEEINEIDVKVYPVNVSYLPKYETEFSAGMDLKARFETPFNLPAGERVIVPTGLYVEIPHGFEAQVRPRSGMAIKYGVTVLNTPGTIDSDFRGEIGVILINHGRDPFLIEPMMKIAQLVFTPIVQGRLKVVSDREHLSDTVRGEGGFGHTGIKAAVEN